MLELWGIWSTPSLPFLPGPLSTIVVTPDSVLSVGQIELCCVCDSERESNEDSSRKRARLCLVCKAEK